MIKNPTKKKKKKKDHTDTTASTVFTPIFQQPVKKLSRVQSTYRWWRAKTAQDREDRKGGG